MLALLILAALYYSVQGGLKLKNGRLVDEKDRQLIIKGGCVVVKVPPYFPKTDTFDPNWSFSDRDIEVYKELGMNGVRLGAMWAGIEPTKDTYNTTYLEQMVKFVNKLGSHGIYTLLDFHQDILSQKFCGDGVPAWLIDEIDGYKTFPIPTTRRKLKLNSSGLPSWQDCNTGNWALYYMSDDVGRGFNHIYDINHHLHKKFVAYWRTIATYFKGNPYVIAYELMNQPFVGDAARNLFLMIPSVAQRLKFQKFYDNVVQNIRQIDNDTNICFEPITFDFAFNSGFTHAPGGKRYAQKSIMCYHFERPPVKGLATMKARIRDSKRLGIPILLSEYGADHQRDAMQFAEDHLQSYFWWQYKDFGKGWGSRSPHLMVKKNQNQLQGAVNPDGTVNQKDAIYYSRTCLHKTAGSLKRSVYRQDTGHFNALYEATPQGTSVLYMNKNIIYKNGYSIDFSPKELLEITENGNYFDIKFIGLEPKLVMINIQRLN